MGIGDEIMAAGHARQRALVLGCPVRIVGTGGVSRPMLPVWEGNPHITLDPRAPSVVNGPGCRPYIQYPFTREGHGYTDWRARDHRATLYGVIPRNPLDESGPFIVIEPTLKLGSNVNKQWPHWRPLVRALLAHRIPLVQLGAAKPAMLPDATWVPTPTFRDALGVLAAARGAILPEGGLHHAAAALGVPATVIFGGSPSVEATGYPEHINLGGADPCGRWAPCAHCRGIMAGISVANVLENMPWLNSI